ncbi:hypothetical protein [Halorussus marinus]|uniref:hypothetical protein n=1 Tax=Halorussus marinus TaxID=2505976 RepID=UPI00106E7747|nr:hypothetical protein [Halorussus marinus]
MTDSKGDPRVLAAMNLVLSSLFAVAVVWGLSFLDVLAYEWQTIAAVAALLAVVTHLVIR